MCLASSSDKELDREIFSGGKSGRAEMERG
jgi:hypothetical protein